jgi:hypothetical protein
MGFYDNFSGGLIGGGKQSEFDLPGVQTLNNSSSGIVRGSLDLHLDAANPSSYPGTGTTWTDLSGNGRNGTLTNGPTFTADLNGTGGYITLDGTNDYISLGANFNYTTQAFSVGLWIYFLNFDHTSAQYVMLFWKGNFQTNGYYSELNPINGTVNFYTNQSGATQQSAANYNANPTSRPNLGFMPGEWYNLCFTRSGTSVRVYINGVDRTSTVGSHTNPATSANNFEIGRYNSASHFPNARFASFIIYQRALSAAEVLQNFNASRKRFNL